VPFACARTDKRRRGTTRSITNKMEHKQNGYDKETYEIDTKF